MSESIKEFIVLFIYAFILLYISKIIYRAIYCFFSERATTTIKIIAILSFSFTFPFLIYVLGIIFKYSCAIWLSIN